jgi:hypothetical protein
VELWSLTIPAGLKRAAWGKVIWMKWPGRLSTTGGTAFFNASTLGSRITLETLIEKVRGQRAAREAQIFEIQKRQRAMENSLSWRLTKPLRQLRAALKKEITFATVSM